jgi:V8-like Glu-specific endopeptidase
MGRGRASLWAVISLGTAVLALPGAVANGGNPGISRTERVLEKDRRVVKDRMHPDNSRGREDDSFLNAVGAVWPYRVVKSAAGYDAATGHDAATGFLVDRCHVLTNMHVAYAGDLITDSPVGRAVAFAVGQTAGDQDKGALQGLRFLLQGTVIAHGDTVIVDHAVRNPESDWAVIRLNTDADGSITPMTIAAVELARLPTHAVLSAAGFPTDHRASRGDGFKLKDLWGSTGRLIGVASVGPAGAFMATTIQTTPGNSGGPIYGDFGGRQHLVVGMVQGIYGNGIDVSDDAPNIEVLFTASTIDRITAAEAESPCR